MFQFLASPINGLLLIKPQMYGDQRGYFFEAYKESEFINAGITTRFLQDNQSLSSKGVLRGLHMQKDPFAQAKLVRCLAGAIWDVAVDLRPGSPTYAQWFAVELNSENLFQLFLPTGFAHGFLTLSDKAEVLYKTSQEYHPENEIAIYWKDPNIAIEWPTIDCDYILSSRDLQNKPLQEIAHLL